VVPAEPTALRDPRVEPSELDLEGWSAALRESGHLDPGWAGRVGAALRDGVPASATWGLRHGDLCAENLVAGPDGLACVDNATVRPGLLELDVAHSLYRWPLPPAARGRFLAGYDAEAPRAREARHDRFWGAAAALRAAAFRVRVGTEGVEVPLRELRRHVA
jgi:aminoglycoside phosphotransferase (APT) family kinase protein